MLTCDECGSLIPGGLIVTAESYGDFFTLTGFEARKNLLCWTCAEKYRGNIDRLRNEADYIAILQYRCTFRKGVFSRRCLRQNCEVH